MEFYLWLVEMFCLPGSGVFSVFAGSKFTCTALVSNKMQFRSCDLNCHIPYINMLAFVFDLLDNLGRSDLKCSLSLAMYR